ncbi:heterokaryon incompatibility protein-domain-containing protein [Xylariales sp. PMI_506]|nr:heterokaryon incompatibility protein-domain-containing protein [Xylariales sp. PMI_506]
MEVSTSAHGGSLYDDVPLDPNRKEIRILIIHYGRNNGLVECFLRVTPLDEQASPFKALSYVWGNADDPTTIKVNGRLLTVTKGLASALRSLGGLGPHRTDASGQHTLPLWVDALCINQGDIAERSQQVRMMGDIYSRAERVLVWLGDGDRFTDYAISRMNSTSFRDRMEVFPVQQRQPSHDEVMVDVIFKLVLCKRPWWRRLWIRQEFILAKDFPLFVIGEHSISWEYLLHCFLLLPRSWDFPELQDCWRNCRKAVGHHLESSNLSVGIHPIAMERIRTTFHDEGGFTLWYAFQYVLRNSAAANPRDYVYGLLGLLNQKDQDAITLDYAVDPMQLYRQVGYILWKQYPEETLSNLLPILTFNVADDSLPSWLPDFRVLPLRGWQDHRAIQCPGPWHQQSKDVFKFQENVLSIQGILFDTVSSVIVAPQQFNDIQEIVPFLRDIESSLYAAINRPISPLHPLHSLGALKHQDTVLQTLTRSSIDDDNLFTGWEDEQVWAALLRPESLGLDPDGVPQSQPDQLFARLSTRLTGKLLGRKVLISDIGFVGVGASQIEVGDMVTWIFGTTAPLVLRPSQGGYRIVGSAYVSGLMDTDLLDHLYEGLTSREMTFDII